MTGQSLMRLTGTFTKIATGSANHNRQVCRRVGIVPDALTIDVEGAECNVLRGANQTLFDYEPKVWVSFHPEWMMKHYGTRVSDVQEFMKDHHYTAEFLGFDHEIHVFYRPEIL
jgi:hypothetical protein